MSLGVYVHVPFCERKCFYCDFFSIAGTAREEEFTEALLREIRMKVGNRDNRPEIESVYFGGGTPSLLSIKNLEKIFGAIKENFVILGKLEQTIEANPGTVDFRKLRQIKEMGFNRISVGVQSFSERDLKFLQRIHDVDDVYRTVSDARKAGFDSLNLDLIFSIPGQSREDLLDSLEKIVSLSPDSISAYGLIYEPGTPLYESWKTGDVEKIDDDRDADNYETVVEFLGTAGYAQVETSNFAKPGKEPLHNLNYWRRGDYFGFGPAAHEHLAGVRSANVADIGVYSRRLAAGESPVAFREELAETDKIEEAIMLGLRSEGLDLASFGREFGFDLRSAAGAEVKKLIDSGKAFFEGDVMKLNTSGAMLCDKISRILIEKAINVKIM